MMVVTRSSCCCPQCAEVQVAVPCLSCGRAVHILAMLGSPRGHYQLCGGCLGPDAARPAPSSDPAVLADRQARAAAVADVLAWLAEFDQWAAAGQRGAA